MIDIVSFAGLDAQTDLGEVRSIMDEYPFAEFAILVGTNTTSGGNHIFPDLSVLDGVRTKLPNGRIASHLYGGYAQVAAGKLPRPSWAYIAAMGFHRIQINLDAVPEFDIYYHSLFRFADFSGAQSVILKHCSPWKDIVTNYPKIEYVFDRSKEYEIVDYDLWPDPQINRPTGYAGGLGPHNISHALMFADKHPDARMWFSIRDGVRDADNWLDLSKVRAVCEIVDGWKDTR